MNNIETYIGYWWLPNDDNQKVYGTLSISQNEYILETIGHFIEGDFRERMYNNREFPILLGLARKKGSHKDYSFKLLHCIIINNSINKIDYCKTIVSFYLITDKLCYSNSIDYNFASFRPKNFDNWISISNLNIDFENQHDFKLSFHKPKEIELVNNLSLKITVGFGYDYNFPDSKGFKLNQRAYLNIYLVNSISLKEFRILIDKVKDFITLAVDNPIEIEECQFSNIPKDKRREKEKIFYYLHTKNKYLDKRYEKPILPPYLFSFDELIKENPNGLFKWIDDYEKMKFLNQNLLGSIYNAYLFEENAFLNYIFSLEFFHRYKYGNGKNRSIKFLNKRKEVIEKQNLSNDKHWLEKYLSTQNSYKLKERLKQLFKEYSEELKFSFIPDNNFIEQIVETRHKLVHENVNKPKIVINDEFELYKTSAKLELTLKAILMKEIGFSTLFIQKKLKSITSGMIAFKKS